MDFLLSRATYVEQYKAEAPYREDSELSLKRFCIMLFVKFSHGRRENILTRSVDLDFACCYEADFDNFDRSEAK
jgi:hypothetical protein